MSALRYLHTLRYLKPVQIYGRLWFRLYRPRPDLSPPPPLRSPGAEAVAWPARAPSMTGPEHFVFLNEEGDLSQGWDPDEQGKLWRYNLHYFDDLNAAGTEKRQGWHERLISRWIAENPPGHGSGWEPYPLSLRIVNWIKWSLAGNRLEGGWLHSLAVQLRYLEKRPEYHLLGNHLFVNAKALVFGGGFFTGPEADAWRAKGLAILAREVPEQVLPDGGHFELSPMYHALILEDLLDLLNLASVYQGLIPEKTVRQWREAAMRMRRWLQVMRHPDGQIPFFNDAAFGIAPAPEELEAYAARLGMAPVAPLADEGVEHLEASGYIRLQRGPCIVLLDVAEVGPGYLPGHAHADTLSFECSLFGQRLIVNSGTSCYGAIPQRARERGTAAHSTVVIDGEDSSEVWGSFRVARRARPFGLAIASEGENLVVQCAHDGYHRLPGSPIHRRSWRLGRHSLTITDQIEGGFRSAVAYYYLHPAIRVHGSGRNGELRLPDGQVIGWQASTSEVEVGRASWHPEFGRSMPTNRLMVPVDDGAVTIRFFWNA